MRNKGITLIALVVTIIILLILAGLTITMLTGENGILTQTRLAQKKTKISSEKEAIEMAICEVQMSNQKEATINLDEIKKSIQKYLDTDNITITNNEKGIANVLVEDSKRVYYIDSNYSVTEYGEFDYLIKNIYDLEEFRKNVNNGNDYIGKSLYMTDDITLKDEWIPIGKYGTNINDSKAFKGIFDGGDHSIYELKIENEEEYQGLFGYNCGIIKNLNVVSGKIDVKQRTGSIVGNNEGKIISCNNKGVQVIGTGVGLGGIAGKNIGIIEDCKNSADIYSEKGSYIGGIAGAVNSFRKNNKL